MRVFIMVLMILAFTPPAAFAELSQADIQSVREFLGLAGEAGRLSCTPNGYSCSASFDCCSGWCREGVCYEIGGGCRGNGARCGTSFDCCSNWCREGRCDEIGGCIPAGGDCERTSECCIGLGCWRGKCD